MLSGTEGDSYSGEVLSQHKVGLTDSFEKGPLA